jgi:uncharacterized protein YbjT (DUF2867 family)
MKILFIGASGMLGKPVAKALMEAGHEVRLLARDTSKLQAIFPNASIINGDILDKFTLTDAMKDMEAVYCNLSVFPSSKKNQAQPEREGIDNILASASQAGVKRISYLSSIVHRYEGLNNFHWWAFQVKASAVRKIKESGIPYLIFYPSTFMETLPYQMVRGSQIATLGKSQMPMWFIAGKDYARQVVKAFQLPQNEIREYDVQGPEPYTFDEAAKVFSNNYRKKKLSLMKVPIGMIRFLSTFNQKLDYGWKICEALNKYPEKFTSENTWRELGKAETTLASYAQSFI